MTNKRFDYIIRSKKKEISKLRELIEAKEVTNVIISAYLSLLVERLGGVRIPKNVISSALSNFRTIAESDGDDYVITVRRIEDTEGNRGGEQV